MTGENMTTKEAESLSVEETMARLSVGEQGLSSEEARSRLDRFGPNTIEEHHVPPIVKFLLHFWGPIPWMIEVAAVLSGIVKHWADLGIVVTLLLVNAIIGFWQEHKADNAIALLKRSLALKAQARRDKSWQTIEAGTLVPGDVVRVRLGDIIPADIKLTAGDYLEIDQSALTGESLPVEKRAGDVSYSGSIVHRGEMDGVVVGTGMNTYLGTTARLVQDTHTVSHYQKAVLRIGHFLVILTLVLVALILLVAVFRHTPLLETAQFALILTVAAIPVALPAVLSVTMAVGAVRLSRFKAIVSRLVSIEEMAGMDVLCSDKTGTLTQNRLEVGEPVTYAGASSNDVLIAAALASRQENPDPIDHAVFQKLGGPGLSEGLTIASYQPFDPVSKRSEATIREGARGFKVTKGAPQVILELCENRDGVHEAASKAVDELAERGYRTLGVARANENDAWQFLGLLPLHDPPREDSAETIRAAKEQGVNIKMVTGDHQAIAREVAGELGLSRNIVTADALGGLGERAEEEMVERAGGFAQVFPEHKHRIVDVLQHCGHIVGMTGDGVNDAPALKKADIGIAVSGATDAARSAADLVLTAPGLSVIIHAIQEARRIFERMTAYATYRIAETIRILLFMTAAILIFDFYPVTAVMIIILALLNDLPIMMIAYDNAAVAPQPVRWDMHKVLTLAVVLGIAGVFASFLMFWIGEEILDLDRASIQTLMFLKLSVAGHMTIYLTRTGGEPFWRRPFPSAALFWTSELTQVVATMVAVYGVFMKPIGWSLALMVWGYAFAWFLFNDFVKIHAYRLITHGGKRERRHIERFTKGLHSHGAA
jgi:H+-transporting ATPase